jgi:hypothetical protein
MLFAGCLLLLNPLWTSLYAHGRDGTGPSNLTFQLASRTDGASGYRISVFEMDQGSGAVLLNSRAFPDPIRFARLEVHHNPSNDFRQVKGQ